MLKTLKKTGIFLIPSQVSTVTETLEKAGFEAYLVGGCVRDVLLGRKPKDWDVTTNADPNQIISLFPKTFYENAYGTVGVVSDVSHTSPEKLDESVKVIEVTPYRLEARYTDYRRPDSVTFSKNLDDDLKRRDFTINAIALKLARNDGPEECRGTVIDLVEGEKDLKSQLVRAVGNPDERFKEDALRTLRALRIAAELNFSIDEDTKRAIHKDAGLLVHIASERIRDEFSRILLSDRPALGLSLMKDLGVLSHVAPELEKSVGVAQNKAHSYEVWEHLIRCVQHAADKKWSVEVRLAALLHDISKPETRRWSGEKGDWTFYGHDVVGARVTRNILTRLKYPNEVIEKVSKLVRWHMFFSDTEVISLSAVRRLMMSVGRENIWELMNVRMADRIGTGRPKESPYRLRKYKSMIEEALRNPISVGMLKINGAKIMELTTLTPGPKIGYILHALLEEALENPEINSEEYLHKRVLELSHLPDEKLVKLGAAGKEKKEGEEKKIVGEIRKKYWVE